MKVVPEMKKEKKKKVGNGKGAVAFSGSEDSDAYR
jgi:hypothetical protein